MNDFTLRLTITAQEHGMLLKEYVQRMGISKRMLADIKFGGGDLLVNGEHVTVRYVLQEGDELVILFPPEKVSESLQPEAIPLDILFEDGHVLVLNKKPFLSSIPSREHPSGSLANGLIHYYRQTGCQATVHLVSRLDRDTSGVMLVAKHRFAHSLLSGLQKKGEVKRQYRAVVHGLIREESGTIDAPIGRKATSIIERAVIPEGQKAVTHFKVNSRIGQLTDVSLSLETGRTHQIRVHMSHIGHPLCGDTLYGGTRDAIKRQALHSERLTFIHPLTREKLTFSAPLPQDIQQLLES
ncbi:RluA family pseudouridine synthase [Bacillus sonorensis]|uniref:Pseudouridine synthase n=3 Tax=Bacillaceae TaxID=186817 RepID=M5PF57_9BACI|nr:MULTISPECIES: RluA family pseudouridine synthase [Bacillus]ASB90099.1 23S rRNA pseudouridine(1911/1915/1917) synthase [Bacillus sonorensis]EME76130.1 pseudouridine synthase YjbO [Bacillus sonorensis L12]MBG9916701.1 pseudouridine synthase [Bacillus sonorensis]MCF7619338.1 RluA family pseudouridine synthase [Bacillus sonorensis]MCY7855701.1 RluA family pseudouridine synthase [Bacillus sonorensis]